MSKELLLLTICLLVAVNIIQQDLSTSQNAVSADPVLNKDIHQENVNNFEGDEEEDEVLVRVARSPDANPLPRGGRGGGGRSRSSRYRGSRYRGGDGGDGGDDDLSTGELVGIVFGVIGGCVLLSIMYSFCCGKD